jgi:NAD(P)-dependent dehydrogenase (short-subunit alcohol dehydrogenase family)
MSLRELWTKSYDVNVSSTQVMTHMFMPLLLKSQEPRLLFITSGLSTLQGTSKSYMSVPTPPIPTGWPKPPGVPVAYRSSKTGLNMAMLNWHWQLQGDGVKVFAVSPGFLATGLGGNKEQLLKAGAEDPSIGGKLIRAVLEGERDGDVGKVVNGPGVQPF